MLVTSAGEGAARLSTIAQWRDIRRVYPIYMAIAREFGYADPPYPALDDVASQSEAEVIGKVEAWLAEMDERFEPHQFRAVLERPELANSEEKLRALIQRHLHKQNRSSADRDKLHYLLAQYAFVCAPPSFRNRSTDLSELAEVMEPVLGSCTEKPVDKLLSLAGLLQLMPRCGSFPALEASVVVPGRQIKAGLGAQAESTLGLLVITHFNYSLRCTYTRLLAEELRASSTGLEKLQAENVTTVDCTALGLSSSEPMDILRQCLTELSVVAPADEAVINARSEQVRALRSTIEATLKAVQAPRPQSDERLVAIEAYVQRLVGELTQTKAELETLRRTVESGKHPVYVPPAQPLAGEAPGDAVTKMPAATVAPPAAPRVKTVKPPAPTPIPKRDFSPEVTRCIEALRKVLGPNWGGSACVVKLGTATIALSVGEMEALFADTDLARPVHRAITARILLLNTIERSKRGDTIDAGGVIEFARATLLELQPPGTADPPEKLVKAVSELRTILQDAEARFAVAG